MSEGPNTDLTCLHCGAHYCAACLHCENGKKMESLTKCASCGKKPRTLGANERGKWEGAVTSTSHLKNKGAGGVTPKAEIPQTISAPSAFASDLRADFYADDNKEPASKVNVSSPLTSPKKSPKKGGSIFDKLTDSSQYTGAHKHRFGADGGGLGLAGRDSVSKGYGSQKIYRGGQTSGAPADLSTLLARK